MVLLTLYVSAWAADAEPYPQTWPFVESMVPVGVVPQGWTVVRDTFVASPDSTHVAVRVSRDGKGQTRQSVLVDNSLRLGGGVMFGPTFSADSSRVATVVSQGQKGRLDVNGVQTTGPDPIAAVVFSPDGQRVAYVGREGKKQLVHADGRSSVVYDEVIVGSLTFSSDSKHLAYVARRDEAWFVVLNGQEGIAYVQVDGPVFSPNSQRLAYWARKPDAGWVVVADGQENTLMRAQHQAGLYFSPDSSQLAGLGQRNGRWHVMIDGRFHHGYDALGRQSFTFSGDSKHTAYAAMDDGRWKVVRDGTIVGEFDALLAGSLRFSPNSSRLVYAAREDDGWFVVIDDERHRDFDRIAPQSIQFSPDSQRLAYVAKNRAERISVVVDGYRWAICDGVEDLAFSPDSASVVWIERRGHVSRVVVDGISGGVRFDQMVPGASLVFDSPSAFHTLVYNRPGPVFFRYQADLYPQTDIANEPTDPLVIPAADPLPVSH